MFYHLEEMYQPRRLIPDYSHMYNYENTENANPNIGNPLQNMAFNSDKNDAYISNIDDILNPSQSASTIKPYEFTEGSSWRGNLSNNKCPSELQYSPINQKVTVNTDEDTPDVPRNPMQPALNNRAALISPNQLDWNSSGNKSNSNSNFGTDKDDEDDEECQPRAPPIHIVSHISKREQVQDQPSYQMNQNNEMAQPVCFADVLQKKNHNIQPQPHSRIVEQQVQYKPTHPGLMQQNSKAGVAQQNMHPGIVQQNSYHGMAQQHPSMNYNQNINPNVSYFAEHM